MPTSEDAQEKEHYLNQTSIVGGPKSSFSQGVCQDLYGFGDNEHERSNFLGNLLLSI